MTWNRKHGACIVSLKRKKKNKKEKPSFDEPSIQTGKAQLLLYVADRHRAFGYDRRQNFVGGAELWLKSLDRFDGAFVNYKSRSLFLEVSCRRWRGWYCTLGKWECITASVNWINIPINFSILVLPEENDNSATSNNLTTSYLLS